MKNLLKGISIVLLLTMATAVVGQKSQQFKGKITYKMSVEGDYSEAEKAKSEGTMTMTYGDGVYKTHLQQMMGSMTFIVFNDSALMVQDAMGQQIAIRMTKEEYEEVEAKMNQDTDTAKAEPVVELIEETKIIAGLKCKKAEVEIGEEIMEVYYYPGYTLPEEMQEDDFKGIDGIPLEYIKPIENGNLRIVATEVKKKKKMKDKEFQVPAGIKVMTMEQVKAMSGQ